jgi:hypothetical protein
MVCTLMSAIEKTKYACFLRSMVMNFFSIGILSTRCGSSRSMVFFSLPCQDFTTFLRFCTEFATSSIVRYITCTHRSVDSFSAQCLSRFRASPVPAIVQVPAVHIQHAHITVEIYGLAAVRRPT